MSSSEGRWQVAGIILAFVLIVGATPAGWIAYSHFEAKAYSKITGKEVTTWDAMFLELRIVDSD